MKHKIQLLMLLLCSFSIVSVKAQRQQVTEDYHRGAIESIPYSQMPGKVSYGYIVSEDGKTLKDGPYSIKCNKSNYQYSATPYTVTLNGNYTLNTTFSKGNLNGNFSAVTNLNVTIASRVSSKKESFTSTMTGSFVDGVPHGAFKISRNGEIKTTVAANYKNGILVGAYSCSLLDDDSRVAEFSGTLTQDGLFNGAWKFNSDNVVFQNGVLISKTNSKESTKPAVVELAKKYVAGTITKEQLLKENSVIVRTDSVALGNYVRTAVFRDSAVEFKELGGYNFSIPNYAKYEYLEEVAIISDEGFDIIEKAYIDYYTHKADDVNVEFLSSRWISGKNTTTPSVDIKSECKEYYISKFAPNNYYVQAYIPYEKYTAMMETIKTTLKANPISLQEFILQHNNCNKICEEYLLGTLSQRAHQISDYEWEKLVENIRIAYYDFTEHSTICPDDDNLMFYQNQSIDTRGRYIKKSTVDTLLIEKLEKDVARIKLASKTVSLEEYILRNRSSISEVQDYLRNKLNTSKFESKDWRQLSQLFKRCYDQFINTSNLQTLDNGIEVYAVKDGAYYVIKESLEDFQKIIHDIESKQILSLSKAFDFMVANRTKTSIAYDEQVTRFFYHTSSDDFRLELDKRLKEFCPIVKYEIVDGNGDYAICRITKEGKKKVQITYEIQIKYKDDKLCVESFDITKAKQVQ